MKIIYIIGEMCIAKADERIRKERDVSLNLSDLGWCPITKQLRIDLFHEVHSFEAWQECKKELLKRSDAVFALDNFRASDAAMERITEALYLGKTVYYQTNGYPKP